MELIITFYYSYLLQYSVLKKLNSCLLCKVSEQGILFAVVFEQVIAMIKGLYGLMSRLEPSFSEAIRRSIHDEVQNFIQINLREPLRKAVKSKKATLLKT